MRWLSPHLRILPRGEPQHAVEITQRTEWGIQISHQQNRELSTARHHKALSLGATLLGPEEHLGVHGPTAGHHELSGWGMHCHKMI